MINPFLKNLNKIEFVITNACTGKCKHCSEGEHSACGGNINPDIASLIVEKTASEYDIKTVMTFGGEPLLYPETVYAVMNTAVRMNIPHRQVITNGFFSTDASEIGIVATELYNCGVNDLLLSVDAFHQETIPLDVVKLFAKVLKKSGVPVRLQPAWLSDKNHDNPYNRKTRQILDSFNELGISESEGNIVFPEGNALKYLSEYFTENLPENPYVENPLDVRCVSVSYDGSVFSDNVYNKDISEILKEYKPY